MSITVDQSVQLNGAEGFRRKTQYQFTAAGAFRYSAILNIGTTHEAVSPPSEIATPGTLFVRNGYDTDGLTETQIAAAWLQVGVDVSGTFYPVAELPAGQSATLPMADVTLYLKAANADTPTEVLLLSRDV